MRQEKRALLEPRRKIIFVSMLRVLFLRKSMKRICVFIGLWSVWNFGAVSAQNLNQLLEVERRALGSNFSEFFVGSINAYASVSTSFFKKGFYPEWRSLVKYPLDTIVKNRFRDRLRLSLTPTSLSESLINYDILFHATKETILLPQMTFAFNHTFYVPIYGLPNETKLQAFSPSLIFSKSVSHHLKFFLGYRFMLLQGAYRLGENEKIYNLIELILRDGTENVTQKFSTQLHYMMVGFSHLSLRNNWENTMSVGIDVVQQNFYYNLEFSNQYIALGFAITPSSVILFRPYFRIQIPI